MLRPEATVSVSVLPSRVRIAYTCPARMLPTNSVPLSPSTIARALGTLSANTEIAKPGGSLIFSRGSFCANALGAQQMNAARNAAHRRDRRIRRTGVVTGVLGRVLA